MNGRVLHPTGVSVMVRNMAGVLKRAGAAFIEDECPRMSAALAYDSAFSLAPLLLVAVAIAGAFFGEDAVRGALEGELSQHMGPGAAFVVQDMLAGARKPADGVLMSVVGIFLLLVGASGVFGQLQAALNKIWNARPPAATGIRGLVKGRPGQWWSCSCGFTTRASSCCSARRIHRMPIAGRSRNGHATT
jgi:membrane protein